MKTKDVKVGSSYLYFGESVIVMERIRGKETNKRNMQSGELFTGYARKPKKFLLNNGAVVFAKTLTK